MDIDYVKNIDELDAVLQLVRDIFPQLDNGEYRYSRDFWVEQMNATPELILYIKDGPTLCGAVLACVGERSVTIGHCCVDPAYRHQGVGSTLIREAEKRIKNLGHNNITLGSIEGAEGFYEKLGYTGSLLIQSQKHSIDELKSLNKTYKIIGTNVYDETVNQLWLQVPAIDRNIQQKYEKTFPGCDTQMIYGKSL